MNKAQKEKERAEQAERQAIIEQERRDREIALRLAAEDQNQVEDVTLPPLVRYVAVFVYFYIQDNVFSDFKLTLLQLL